jgi:hypothetical protein
VPKGEGVCPALKKDMAAFASDHYEGYFNTDHLLPSVFFQEARDPKDIPAYRDLDLKYIYGSEADPKDHADLVLGSDATWFEVKRNLDRLPRTLDPETVATLTPKMEGQLKNWAAEHLKQRM